MMQTEMEIEETRQLQSYHMDLFCLLILLTLLFRSRPPHQKLKLIPEILKYPCVNVGSTTLLKADIKNGYLEDVKVGVV